MVVELKIALLKTKKSQMQVAQESGIDPSALSRILNGWLVPSENKAENLAQAMGITVKALHNALKKNKRGEESKKTKSA